MIKIIVMYEIINYNTKKYVTFCLKNQKSSFSVKYCKHGKLKYMLIVKCSKNISTSIFVFSYT